MNSPWTGIIIAVLSLFVIIVTIGQVFFSNGDKLEVETAYYYDFEEEVPFDGVYLRDEQVIYNSDSGVLSFECADGSKVGKSSVIARRCKSQSDIAYQREIEALQSQAQVLSNAEKLVGTDNSQLDAISVQINQFHSDIVGSIQEGDYLSAAQYKNSLLEAMCKREITLNGTDGYSAKITELNNEIDRLNSLISNDVRDVTANAAGYFESTVDGYEGEFGFSDMDKLSEETINEIISNPVKSDYTNAIGKLIADYHWRTAAVVDMNKMFGINEGSNVTLRIGSNPALLDAQVVSVQRCGDDKAIYVFECDRLNSTVASGRVAHFKLLIKEHNGLRVPRKALQYNENDERGVFVLLGQSVEFRKIDVVYWGEDFVICSQNQDDEYLKLYDKIIVEGKDLYDGKIVR